MPPRRRFWTLDGVISDTAIFGEQSTARSRIGRASRWWPGPLLACVLAGAAALWLALYSLTIPSALFGIHPPFSGYDDGVYFAVSVRFVNGVMPYRDFVFVQPPGIAYVMAPLALLSHVTGTEWGLALARVLTAVVVGVNASLVALALRRFGTVAMVIGGAALALFPLTAAAASQNELEPYVIFFLLIALVIVFRDAVPVGRMFMIGGISAGFATSIKLVAVVPAIAMVICLLPQWRRMRSFVLGAAIGFVAPLAPFLVAAPSTTFREIVVDQLGRMDASTLSFAQRLVMITGIGSPANVNRMVTAEVLTAAFAFLVVVVYAIRLKSVTRFEWCALLCAAAVVFEFHLSKEFFDHYAYMPAPFLALLIGIVVGRSSALITTVAGARVSNRRTVWVPKGIAVAAAGAIVGAGVPHIVGYEHHYVNGSIIPTAMVQAAVPAGACVVTDQVTVTLLSNRFDPAKSGCPAEIDPYGTFLAYDAAHPPPGVDVPASFLARWQTYFAKADDIVLSSPYLSWIPSDSNSQAAFTSRYVDISSGQNIDVWVPRRALSSGSG